MTSTAAEFESRKARLSEALRGADAGGVRLAKDTSNLFRDRKAAAGRTLDVRDFNHVLEVDPDAGVVEVEGMTPYADLVRECLRCGVMPAVVPQLRSITIGGAVTGLGIESSSFRYGLVHETVQEMEVLLADGSTVICTPDNEHSDLFYGFPNSYGTLGYALRIKAKTVPVRPYVHLRHIPHHDPARYFGELHDWCERQDVDFVDGTIFGAAEMYITVGTFCDEAPYTSDYGFEHIYYKSIRQRQEDYLAVSDYIWRWDTDWFWCSKNLFAQNPLVRRLLGRERLSSVTYTRIMRWNARWGITRRINRLLGHHTESVIQDVEIPIDRCEEFLEFYLRTIRFTPVWVCPVRACDKEARFDLYRLDPQTLYVNFGFWDVIRRRAPIPEGYHNRLVEQKVRELEGMKSLYSDVFYTPETFWEIYGGTAYERLKDRYDPDRRLKDLYAKTVSKE